MIHAPVPSGDEIRVVASHARVTPCDTVQANREEAVLARRAAQKGK
ncbi:MAG TPA: hypothetical protein VH186_37080 [Chloroflexia bacterium]|nr:hypothetical protein [Chloroflexia bacterium]